LNELGKTESNHSSQEGLDATAATVLKYSFKNEEIDFSSSHDEESKRLEKTKKDI
jgi:hypothetical protein